MEFLTFPKIASGAMSGTAATSGTWIAQEKIHGAQLVIGLERNEIHFGKRKAWLADGESFFGWQLIRAELARLAWAIRAGLEVDDGDSVYLYGELFGGKYPHPEVPPVSGMMPVQTGVWYTPDIRWSVFDVVICPAGNIASAHFVDQRIVMSATNRAGGYAPPVIARGRRQELSFIEPRFVTKVPEYFGLPELDKNWAEGVVIKPEAGMPLTGRDIIKRKIEEFNEKQFDESAPWDSHQQLPFDELLVWARKLVNPARLASARSKVGDVDSGVLADEVALDVMVDLTEAFPDSMASLTEEQEKLLRDAVMEMI